MDDSTQMALLILLTAGLFLCLLLAGIKKLFSIVLETDENEYGDIVEDDLPVTVIEHDNIIDSKVENTKFEITNMEGAEVVTEVVYAD